MRSVLILDQGAVGLAIALRAAQAGWTVYWWVEPKPENIADKVGLGYHKNIHKVTEWRPLAKKVDLLIATENGSEAVMQAANRFKKQGAPAYIPSMEAINLEINRGAGMRFLQDHGIQVPEFHMFKSLKDMAKYVEENEGPWVCKPEGDNDNKALSFVSDNDGQMLQQISVWEKQKQPFENGQIMLQKRVNGIEMAVCAWVGADGFIGPFSESFEHKKLMPSNAGPSTGEMGTVIKYVRESKLGEAFLRPLEKDLAAMGAHCSCDVNCMIDDKGSVWPLEFTMRFGWPATNLMLYLHRGDPLEFMVDALNGEDTLEVSYDTGICVVLAGGDFPYGNWKPAQTVGMPLYGINKNNEPNIQPQSLMMDDVIVEDGDDLITVQGPVTAGDYWAIVVETGKTVEAAQRKVYKIVKGLKGSDMKFRDDIGDRVIEELPRLQGLGFATDWEEPQLNMEEDNQEDEDKPNAVEEWLQPEDDIRKHT